MSTSLVQRYNGRRIDEIRPLKATYNIYEYAAGSVLFEQGKTKILCSVTMQHGVPPFLRGKNSGWVNAEYALLPASTLIRTAREATSVRRQGRSVEISRLISRALRTVIDLSGFPDRTIHIDCDVLQADGGTRTACITAAFAALKKAEATWLGQGRIEKTFIMHNLAAVSVGILEGKVLLDPDYHEDSSGQGDINFIMTSAGQLVEVQGGAETDPIDWELFQQAATVAQKGVQSIFDFFKVDSDHSLKSKKTQTAAPLFSIKNRQQQSTP